jgi:glutamate dehydrogenase
MFEIYVHSRRLEGIHLRGGKVARGGIRWSDRHDDFRTEVLGLMKTQMVKNSIIVPVGSKGGFVLKGDVPGRPALDDYLIDRYREFVSGLLDVTDNRVDGRVLHPPEVIRLDGDDPYLVVAADKGTAHLSDTANSVSAQYGFWLGDAFASGGSAGYDHKKMAITARGAWECVKHHFRNLGVEVQRQPFAMAGIGDMSGDVFGNGALQSRATRLVAAFNHLHIFVDPDPDPERSFQERTRLFELPRSTWRDYDPALISPGGGVFDRSAKAIPLSPEMKKVLEIEGEAASGEEVVRKILSARVDLLYNGGIGTYVKATTEDDAEVGDRANDRVRVDGRDVRARVVAEGGNLGFTQKGRLEVWAQGGLLNTDAVDNSGGVDTSDHEVNIKILLDMLIKKGVIKGRARWPNWSWPTTRARPSPFPWTAFAAPAATRSSWPSSTTWWGPGSSAGPTSPSQPGTSCSRARTASAGSPGPSWPSSWATRRCSRSRWSWRRTSRTASRGCRSSTPISRGACARASPSTSRLTSSGARSWPPPRSTTWSTRPGSRSSSG